MQMNKIWSIFIHRAQQLILATPPLGLPVWWQAHAIFSSILVDCIMITSSLEPLKSNKKSSEESDLRVHVLDRANIAVTAR